MRLNKLFYLLMAVSTIFVACSENTQEPTQEPTENTTGTLTVLEKAVDMPFYGGEGTINFRIDGGNEYDVPTVTTTAEWVNNIAAVDVIVFNVDRNNTTESRVASVKVEYGQQSFEVFVRQDASWKVDVEFTAKALNGKYYGTQFGDPNYFVILSTYGTTGESDVPFVDSYYRLDMFSKTPADTPVMLPHGIYTYDPYAIGVGDSFGGSFSRLFQTFEDGHFEDPNVSNGVVFVTENRVEAYLQLTTGKVHHVVYEGSLEIDWLKFDENEIFSTLTSDFTFNETGGKLRIKNYGDLFGVGANNYSVSMIAEDEMNGVYFVLDLVTNNNNTGINSILGTYNVAATANDLAYNTYLAGTMNGTQYVGSWYMNIAGGYIDHSNRAPLVGGTITIEQDGNNYITTYDCVDDKGYKVKGTYSCSVLESY